MSLSITDSWQRCLKVDILYAGEPGYVVSVCVG
jgi:hypothetical protein